MIDGQEFQIWNMSSSDVVVTTYDVPLGTSSATFGPFFYAGANRNGLISFRVVSNSYAMFRSFTNVTHADMKSSNNLSYGWIVHY